MEAFNFLSDINILQAVFLIAGLVLVIIEMFFPGFGAPGITGLILLAIGIVMTADTMLEALILIIIILAILGVALTLVLHSATRGRLSKTLILSDSLNKESGFSSTEDLNYFVDKEGTTVTVLRPAGTADFNGVKLDVVSESEYIPRDTKIKVVEVSGRRIAVREIK